MDCCPETTCFYEQSPETVVRSAGSPAAGTGIRSGPQLRAEGAGAEEGSHLEKGALRWGRNMASPRVETLGTWRYGRWKTRDLQAMRLDRPCSRASRSALLLIRLWRRCVELVFRRQVSAEVFPAVLERQVCVAGQDWTPETSQTRETHFTAATPGGRRAQHPRCSIENTTFHYIYNYLLISNVS